MHFLILFLLVKVLILHLIFNFINYIIFFYFYANYSLVYYGPLPVSLKSYFYPLKLYLGGASIF